MTSEKAKLVNLQLEACKGTSRIRTYALRWIEHLYSTKLTI